MLVATDYWSAVLPEAIDAERMAHIGRLASEAESRRGRADYNTGSILETEAYALWSLSDYLKARVVIEVGTFVGLSTTALASASTVESVYTCDASNDCLESSAIIRTYPEQSSTHMLKELVARGVTADLCFFDGTLAKADLPLLQRVTRPDTVFALHDYNYGPKIRRNGMEIVPRKGIGNARLLQPRWPTHVVLEPMPDTTLALLVPSGAA